MTFHYREILSGIFLLFVIHVFFYKRRPELEDFFLHFNQLFLLVFRISRISSYNQSTLCVSRTRNKD